MATFRLLLGAMLLAVTAAAAAEPLNVGVLAYRGEGRALERWTPTMDYLREALPGQRFEIRPFDLEGMTRALADGNLDFLLTQPGQYGMLAPRYRLTRLATLRPADRSSARHATGSVLLVRAGSHYRDPRALEGRPVAAVHPRAFGGFLLLRAALARRGIDAREAYDLHFLGYPVDRLLLRLQQGEVEAAIVPACLLERMDAEDLLERTDFRALMVHDTDGDCLTSTALYPAWSFAALPGTSEALNSAVARALLRMPAADGDRWGAPVSQARVERLLDELSLHPLHPPLSEQIATWVADNRTLVVLAAVFALLGLLHHCWLQALARRRAHQLRATHARLQSRERELAAAQRASLVGEMATELAHELNQPLAAIRNYAEGCLVRLRRDDPAHPLLPILRRIDDQAERGAAVVARTRASLRRETPPNQPVRLGPLIRHALALHEHPLRRRDVTVSVDVRPPELTACAEPRALEQVLGNLVTNAVEAYATTGCGGPLWIEAGAVDDAAVVRVRDAAGGFPAAHLDEPFVGFRSTRPEGLGMGLLICRRLMIAQGGTIALANRDGGAEITLRLPLETDDDACAGHSPG
ncbi:PhnD/SsuA/transferrin family substrate-binding protein [Arhodomonas aquaeolei]|uniref:PhnD/SsuA/transferrin family substrate-binding protein n=1 Tax=Arhodomonas aquaeolei TaxID=2369 RepID=UPI0021676151|nr:PhnD/SsuA/transferrin family substrate-binding protein [Arhodomonas aquaeolei]MCS4505968.1 PhnD/SsuA/transferrin family substrate-binding protein [Arhodomonas aquaeolei]